MARRTAVAGWTAAALLVSGSLALPSCAGETVAGPDDGGSGLDTGIGPGLCPLPVDSGVDTGYVAGICNVAVDATVDVPDAYLDTGIGPGICPIMVADSGQNPPVGGIC
jgi:hypothetical protein